MCDKCIHKQVCKYVESYKDAQIQARELGPIDDMFELEAKCKCYIGNFNIEN